jgi:hypothetical protein
MVMTLQTSCRVTAARAHSMLGSSSIQARVATHGCCCYPVSDARKSRLVSINPSASNGLRQSRIGGKIVYSLLLHGVA